MATGPDDTVFARNPLLIARMDQLSRSEELLDQLADSDWHLVVVDEAHRMAALGGRRGAAGDEALPAPSGARPG